jgi:hypothetical protein
VVDFGISVVDHVPVAVEFFIEISILLAPVLVEQFLLVYFTA